MFNLRQFWNSERQVVLFSRIFTATAIFLTLTSVFLSTRIAADEGGAEYYLIHSLHYNADQQLIDFIKENPGAKYTSELIQDAYSAYLGLEDSSLDINQIKERASAVGSIERLEKLESSNPYADFNYWYGHYTQERELLVPFILPLTVTALIFQILSLSLSFRAGKLSSAA